MALEKRKIEPAGAYELDETEKISDNDLARVVREGDSERYGEIIERYQGKLFAYLYRLIGNREEAQDLLQDVFIKVYRNLRGYDADRKFSSWIYRIAHNEAVNHIKRKSLKRFVSWESVVSTKDKLESSSNEEGAQDAWVRKEISQEVNAAIDKLPAKYKQVLLLRYYSDNSYEEISEILGRPVNTVGTLINRAKRKLAEELESLKKDIQS
ncbi:MAG: polymerase sigma factor [Patescibacteria group bacterium]|nr:polymerase sigma factor [Patescibacteria group bacterium]